MGGLIVLIMLVLLAVTHVQFYITRDLAYLEEKDAFEALRMEFEQYYRSHGNSWEDVESASFESAAPLSKSCCPPRSRPYISKEV